MPTRRGVEADLETAKNARGKRDEEAEWPQESAKDARGEPPKAACCGPVALVCGLQVARSIFSLAAEPAGDFIVVHNVVSNQIGTIVKEHDPPLQMHADFIRSGG